MKIFGFAIVIAAIGLGMYAFFVFNPTVGTGFGDVYNVGRLQERQNMLIVAGVGAGIGTLLMLFGASSERNPAQDQFAAVLEMGNLDVMEQLIDSGMIDPNGRAPGNVYCWLRTAVLCEGVKQCELLLRKGADPSRPDGMGTNIIDYVHRHRDDSPAIQQIQTLFKNPPKSNVRHGVEDAPAPPGKTLDSPRRGSPVSELSELARLHESGHLTLDEFERAKARVLG